MFDFSQFFFLVQLSQLYSIVYNVFFASFHFLYKIHLQIFWSIFQELEIYMLNIFLIRVKSDVVNIHEDTNWLFIENEWHFLFFNCIDWTLSSKKHNIDCQRSTNLLCYAKHAKHVIHALNVFLFLTIVYLYLKLYEHKCWISLWLYSNLSSWIHTLIYYCTFCNDW